MAVWRAAEPESEAVGDMGLFAEACDSWEKVEF